MTANKKAQVEAYLVSCSNRLLEFGKWDCALFCGDILTIIKGHDPAAPWRGTYHDREGYLAALPFGLAGLPEHIGLKPIKTPCNGAVWWSPGVCGEGGLGIFWQGRAIQPGRRGLREGSRDITKLKFYA